MGNQKLKDKDKGKEERTVENLGWTVFCIAVLAGVAYFLHFGGYEIQKEAASWGAMGDYFGGILNPLIAGCALYVLIKSFKVQKQELKEARDELAKASEAQQLQAQLTQKQIEQVDRQNFESLFLRLLENTEKPLKLFEFKRHGPSSKGGVSVRTTYGKNGLEEGIYFFLLTLFQSKFGDRPKIFVGLENYIFALVSILKKIDQAPDFLDTRDKEEYINILVNNLSPYELRGIFYFFIETTDRIEKNPTQYSQKDILLISQQLRLIQKYDVLRDLSFKNTDILNKILYEYQGEIDVSSVLQSETRMYEKLLQFIKDN
ncbi:putative phage abortive infection protein [Vitreoscilla stercoraria]|uniref:Phage abortive infection protein n=1 Tax=Vitreoscilla stercoraria TaxID=61 RepID=A0ABY4EBA6_VITST|nr:putative phage abortive infection protein [Vitreoscilla stercoraria]UOO92690.1 hypothetical protein LVJ81_01165 [Vitreoscilla stercoraria]